MEKKRLYLIIGACAAFVAGVLILALLASLQQNNQAQQQPDQQLNDYTGNLACLPHKNVQPGQPQTLECAIGLMTTDGKYYGLKDMPDEYKYIEFSTDISVVGELTPPTDNEKYDIAGTIKVKTIEALPTSD